jgi:hypothetical protein
MSASRGARFYLFSMALVGVLVYLPIIDLGVSAGRIHHGVSVAGVDVGGLTEEEAVDRLRRRIELLRSEPVVFFGPEGLSVQLHPATIGWYPFVARSARAAMRIGRDGAPLGALHDRWRGWFGGVKLRWVSRPNSKTVREFVDRVERQVNKAGYELDRPKLRRKVKRGINTWPRRQLRVPVIPG